MEPIFEWMRRHGRLSFFLIFLGLIGIGVLIQGTIEAATTVFDEVRIDFDDLLGVDLVGVGTMGLALAALLRVFKNGWVEKHHHEQLEERVRLLEEGRIINGLDEVE